MSTLATDFVEHVLATPRAHKAKLRQAGIHRPSPFGFVARGDAEADRDVDLAAELEPDAQIGFSRLGRWNTA